MLSGDDPLIEIIMTKIATKEFQSVEDLLRFVEKFYTYSD